ncbi:MAG: hypothetical protein U9R25_01550 [Chloroflexota bacterium]|nr:hypothetical protein [Chloroflexota bacterium]
MACINADGTISASGQAVLQALQQPASAGDIAERTGLRLFKIRGSLRELVDGGLLLEEEGQYSLTGQGMAAIST